MHAPPHSPIAEEDPMFGGRLGSKLINHKSS